jgi:hypothetical protein
MKGLTKDQLLSSVPSIKIKDGASYCIQQLIADTEHSIKEEIVRGLTYEEVIGILLLVLREIEENEMLDEICSE